MINGIVIRTNNTVERFEGTLEDMQKCIDGYVETVRSKTLIERI